MAGSAEEIVIIDPGETACFSVTSRIAILIRPAILVLTVLGPLYCPAAESPDVEEPTQVVDALHDTLVEIASNSNSLSYASRFRALEPAIRNSHDFSTIARLVGGRFWKDLSDNQRSLFIKTLSRASIATYARRFASAKGVNFAQATLHEISSNRARVRSELTDAEGSRVMFEYVLHDDHDQWQIINILVEGVSDLALQRAELIRIYVDTGFPGVMKYFEARAGGG